MTPPLTLEALEQADAATLRRHWSEAKGAAPPRTFTARLMRLSLAWEVKVARAVGETAQTQRAWARVVRARSSPCAKSGIGGRETPTVTAGSRILKEWGGALHEVLIAENGAAIWNGQNYSSLSAVTRAMTGTNRNGPKFFGLREGPKP